MVQGGLTHCHFSLWMKKWLCQFELNWNKNQKNTFVNILLSRWPQIVNSSERNCKFIHKSAVVALSPGLRQLFCTGAVLSERLYPPQMLEAGEARLRGHSEVWYLSQLPRAAITYYHKPSVSNNRNVLSHLAGGQRSEVKMSAVPCSC